MTWASAKPTTPGWYWYKESSLSPVSMIWIRAQEHDIPLIMALDGWWGWLQSRDGQFAGPLDPPAAEEGEDD